MKKHLLPLFFLLFGALCLSLAACGKEKTYTVTFNVGDQTFTQTVAEGETPVFEGSTELPVDDVRYVFTGWLPALAPATADATYTALYDERSATTYEITFRLADTEMSVLTYEGELPVLPEGAADDRETQYTFETFKGWNTEIVPATEDTIYIGRYTSTLKKFEITFDVDGATTTKTVTAKEMPVYSGKTPAKNGYVFLGWDKQIVMAGGDVTYTAVFAPVNDDTHRITLSQEGLVTALNTGYSGYTGNNGQKTGPWNATTALFFLLVEEHDNPGLSYVHDWILSELRVLIAPNNEPDMAHGAQWSFATCSAALAMARNTPSVWDDLTAEEQAKVDLLMRCMTYTSAFEMNDCNDYKTPPSMVGNFNKGWNPNFRFVGLAPMLAAKAYFGSAQAVNDVLLAFDYDAVTADLAKYHYNDALAIYTAAGKNLMENGGNAVGADGTGYGTGKGVRQPFVYQGFTLDEPEKILNHLLDYTYGTKVVSTIVDSRNPELYGAIATGKTSPMEGRQGMIIELAGGDAGGLRSSAAYSMADFHMATTTLTLLIELGEYDPATDMSRDLMNRVYVGNTDLLFKLREGYYNCANGHREEEPFKFGGYGNQPLVAELWENHLSGWIKYEKLSGYYVDYTDEQGNNTFVTATAETVLRTLPDGYIWFDGKDAYFKPGMTYTFPEETTLVLTAVKGSIGNADGKGGIITSYTRNLILRKDSSNDEVYHMATDTYSGWIMVDMTLSVDDPQYMPIAGNVQYKHTQAANPSSYLLTFGANGEILACDEYSTQISSLTKKTHIIICYNTTTGEVNIYNVAGTLLLSFTTENDEGTAGRLAYFYLSRAQAQGDDGKERHLNAKVRIGYGFDKPMGVTYTDDEIIELEAPKGTTLETLPDGYVWFDGNATYYRPGATFDKMSASTAASLIAVKGSIAEGRDTARIIGQDARSLTLLQGATSDTSFGYQPGGLFTGCIMLDMTLSVDAPAYFPAGGSIQYKHTTASNPASGILGFDADGNAVAVDDGKTVIANFKDAPAHIYIIYDTTTGDIFYYDDTLTLKATANQPNDVGTAGRLMYVYLSHNIADVEKHLNFTLVAGEGMDKPCLRAADPQ